MTRLSAIIDFFKVIRLEAKYSLTSGADFSNGLKCFIGSARPKTHHAIPATMIESGLVGKTEYASRRVALERWVQKHHVEHEPKELNDFSALEISNAFGVSIENARKIQQNEIFALEMRNKGRKKAAIQMASLLTVLSLPLLIFGNFRVPVPWEPDLDYSFLVVLFTLIIPPFYFVFVE